MPDLKNKTELANAAKTLAASYELVQRGTTTYIPVHWQTLSPEPLPDPKESIWLPLTRNDKKNLAVSKSQILFATDAELRNFDFMLGQLALEHSEDVVSILIKTQNGLKVLDWRGNLVDHDGTFTPNYVQPVLNEDQNDKDEVYRVLVEWLGGEEEAESLLYHLATMLSPGYSAVKYVLLLGEGRNGKGVLLSMLSALVGKENISSVTRQMMAERSSTCVELNNKLINVIFDGEMAYIKDSSMEKTLIAGEPAHVRMLYESGTTEVQTNALFLEALNLEPKTRDKSSALQKRLARFHFPKVYTQDKAFHRLMTSEPMLGALLSLLIDHYVREDEVAEKLVLTKGSMELQMEQAWIGTPILQFLEFLSRSDPLAIGRLESGLMTTDVFINSFKPWAEQQGLHDRTDGDLLSLIKQSFELGWKTVRDPNTKIPSSKRVIKALKPETVMALNQLKGDSGVQAPGAEQGPEESGTDDSGDPQGGDARAGDGEAADNLLHLPVRLALPDGEGDSQRVPE
jgi:putative DNA primase/helicase